MQELGRTPSIFSEQEQYRVGIVAILERGIQQMQLQGLADNEDVGFARQALNFLKQNRISRVDTSRHLNLMLN